VQIRPCGLPHAHKQDKISMHAHTRVCSLLLEHAQEGNGL
jgi:hypothetical protein